MAEIDEEVNKQDGVFGGVEFEGEIAEQLEGVEEAGESAVFQKVEVNNLPVKQSPWTRIKNFLFKEIDLTAPIKVELTPYQQKVEDEINEFLHQEISIKGFFELLRK